MKHSYLFTALCILLSATLLRAQTGAPNVTITSQPADFPICTKASVPSVSFSVSATASSGTLTYQWQILKNSVWTNINDQDYKTQGATTNKLTLPWLTTYEPWTVRAAVTATNSAGSTTTYSNSASTLPVSLPSIKSGPTGPEYVCQGSTLTLNVQAQGYNLSYLWRTSYNNAPVPGTGVNTATLTIPNVQPAYDNLYYVEVSNVCGTLYASYELKTAYLPVIRQQPPATLVIDCSSPTPSLCVNANNDGHGPNGTNYYVQWETRANSSASWANVASGVTGASGGPYTGDTHCLPSLPSVADGQQYRLKFYVPNCSDVLYSSVTTLQTQAGIAITTQPASSSTVCRGANVTTSVAATGQNLTYQWYKGTTLLNGVTTATLKLNNIQTSQGGTYTVKVANACGSVTSQPFTVAVTGSAPTISTTYPPLTACQGSPLQLAKPVTSDPSVTYQWLKDGQPIGPADNNGTLNFASLSLTDAGSYSVRVTSSCGSTTSAPFTLSVSAGATITAQPVDAVVNCGSTSATFAVTATGQNLTYQWESRDNASAAWQPVSSGGTTAQLSVPSGLLSNGRQFRVGVSSSTCPAVVYSNAATLTLKSPLTFTQQPTDMSICPTGTARFSVGVNNGGGGTVTIRWEYSDGNGWLAASGTGFSGNTTGNFYVSGSQLVNGRRFRAVVKVAACPTEVASSEAVLRVDNQYAPALTSVTPDQTIKSGSTIQGITATGTGGNGALKITWGRNTVAALTFSPALAQSGTDADFPIARTITSTATTNQSLVFSLRVSDAVGCSSTAQSKVTVQPPTVNARVQPESGATDFTLTLYPNPSNGRVLHVQGSEVDARSIALYNLAGVALPVTSRQVATGLTEVKPLDRLPSGVYMLKIRQGVTVQYRRLLIE